MEYEDSGTRMPLVSIILPTWNCEGYLEEALHSVLSHLPEDDELIVVDDGSTDSTAQKLSELEGTRPNIRIAFRKHAGASAARNAGLDMAGGKYVFFLDCDDVLTSGFLKDTRSLLSTNAALYIFGIERVLLNGKSEFWTVRDHSYESASDFADEYVRVRRLLVYSNCNKFYRRSILEKNGIRFVETTDFGEDRLFNYRFLSCCKKDGRIVTSAYLSIRYIQRSNSSLSTKHVPNYFRRVMVLHEEKMRCFQSLAEGVSSEEWLDFKAYDFSREIEGTLERFQNHPEEIAQNLPEINRIAFGETTIPGTSPDIIVILGSSACDYKVRAAVRYAFANPHTLFIVSGGNLYVDQKRTEAEFMAAYLVELGVPIERICLENKSRYTKQNLIFSAKVIQRLREEGEKPIFTIGIVTGGFHIPRAKLLVERLPEYAGEKITWIAAYGPNTHIDTWYMNKKGRAIILEEIRKTVREAGMK